jgi:hypothetical protein
MGARAGLMDGAKKVGVGALSVIKEQKINGGLSGGGLFILS